MQIVDLTEENESIFLACMKGWCSEHLEAGNRKANWCRKMAARGLRVKLAIDDAGQPAGLIQYLPIEESNAEGSGLHFIQCIWVHGYREGIGNVQGRGMGKALLQAAEDDACQQGAAGMAAWGMDFDWMPAAWFIKQGYQEADKNGHAVLVWKPFTADAAAPKWVRPRKKPTAQPGKVTITVFANGWCQSANAIAQRFCLVAKEFALRSAQDCALRQAQDFALRQAQDCAGQVEYREIDTTNRQAFAEWGIDNGVFIDDQEYGWPPPTADELRKIIRERLSTL